MGHGGRGNNVMEHRMTDRILREPECKAVTGLSRSTRWRLEQEGKFPARRQISPSAMGWLESEISDWIASREAAA